MSIIDNMRRGLKDMSDEELDKHIAHIRSSRTAKGAAVKSRSKAVTKKVSLSDKVSGLTDEQKKEFLKGLGLG